MYSQKTNKFYTIIQGFDPICFTDSWAQIENVTSIEKEKNQHTVMYWPQRYLHSSVISKTEMSTSLFPRHVLLALNLCDNIDKFPKVWWWFYNV